jgi:hypothetical protein
MNRQDFEHLRDLPDKFIPADIVFVQKDSRTTLSFERVVVQNAVGIELFLNGSYVPDIPSLKFNFSVRGVGAICRIEINSKEHPPAGRTHKHTLETESCPRLNLPNAVQRPDFDLSRQSPREIWEIICREANIVHAGEFREPR